MADLRIEYTPTGISTVRESWLEDSSESSELENLAITTLYEPISNISTSSDIKTEIVANARRLADLFWHGYSTRDFALSPVTAEIEREFRANANAWLQETGFLSDPVKKFMHPAHLRIIGMGKDILPLILRELEHKTSHWFVALTAISPVNPVAPEDESDFNRMTEAWLKWGREEGLI